MIGEIVYCPDCGGDGKETCHNPDHGFISAFGSSGIPGSGSYELGRLGCPCCGHHPEYKVNRGKNKCDTCNGEGTTDYYTAKQWAEENEFDGDLEPLNIIHLKK